MPWSPCGRPPAISATASRACYRRGGWTMSDCRRGSNPETASSAQASSGRSRNSSFSRARATGLESRNGSSRASSKAGAAGTARSRTCCTTGFARLTPRFPARRVANSSPVGARTAGGRSGATTANCRLLDSCDVPPERHKSLPLIARSNIFSGTGITSPGS